MTFAAESISAIHSVGVPWYLSIPLAAVGVNFSIRLPIQYYTRQLIFRRNQLNPLISAWNSRHAAAVPLAGNTEHIWRMRVAALTSKAQRRIYKAWGVQRWKTLAPFLSMVPFVIVSEALRRLSGAPMGWISHSIGLTGLPGEGGLFNPDLLHGGCLWFVDLTAMDPYFALPALSSILMAKSSWGRLSKTQLRALLSLDATNVPKNLATRIQTSIGRALLLVPLVPMLFADLPSAIFLYWATTFALNDINESILDRTVPRYEPKLKIVRKASTTVPYLRGHHRQGSGEKKS